MLWISDNQQQHVPGAADDTVQRVIFGGQKYLWTIRGYYFSWLLLALQVKVVKIASFVGIIFVLQCMFNENHKYFPLPPPGNY